MQTFIGIVWLYSQLLAMHRTAVLRHDELGQETLLNLLLRNHLSASLYDQVRLPIHCCQALDCEH